MMLKRQNNVETGDTWKSSGILSVDKVSGEFSAGFVWKHCRDFSLWRFLKVYWTSPSRNDCVICCNMWPEKALGEGRELSDLFTVISDFSTKFYPGRMQSYKQFFTHSPKVMYLCNVLLRYLMCFSRSHPYEYSCTIPYLYACMCLGELKQKMSTPEMCSSLHNNATDASHILLGHVSLMWGTHSFLPPYLFVLNKCIIGFCLGFCLVLASLFR